MCAMESVDQLSNRFNHRHAFCETNGIRLHYIDEAPTSTERATIVLCHGFPDFWFGWRHQIPVLKHAGFRVLVPDFRGDSLTEKTKDLASYRWRNICADIKGMLNHAKVSKAIFLGHDWGGWFVWRMSLWFPECVLAVGSIVTAYLPPSKVYLSSRQIAERLPTWKYQQYFDESSEEAVKELEADPARAMAAFLRMSYDRPGISSFWMKDGTLFGRESTVSLPKSTALSDDEFDFYVSTFQKSGFGGCINYYRTRWLNFEDEKELLASPERCVIYQPALMITASKDYILKPELSQGMEKVVKNLTRAQVEAGHWAHVEKKDEVNKILLEWLHNVVNQSKL